MSQPTAGQTWRDPVLGEITLTRRAVAGGCIDVAVVGWDYTSEDRTGWLPELALLEGECVEDRTP